MNSYFIVYEYECPLSKETCFNFLKHFSYTEDFEWYTPNPSFDLQSYIESILDISRQLRHVNAHGLDAPYFFSSIEDAKLAIKTIKALETYDELCFAPKNEFYHIVCSKTKRIPTSITEVVTSV